MTNLTPETQAKVQKALDDRDAANTADGEHAGAQAALTLAAHAEEDSKNAALQAHQQALESAHDALTAVAAELGVALS